jgi:alkaline phosphatase D
MNLPRAALGLAVVLAGTLASAATEAPRLTHGVAAGDVTDSSAVLWARCDRPSTLHVLIDGRPPLARPATSEHDGIAQVVVDGLTPATPYHWTARCDDGPAAAGTFRTAPSPVDAAPLRLAWGGDVGGQNVCRDAAKGYPIFRAVAASQPDVFLALGDLIYADDVCLAVGLYGNVQVPGPGPATDLDGFRAQWRYDRADAAFQALLAKTPVIGVWDDHEVRDDFGPGRDTNLAGVSLMSAGLQAFTEWTPMRPGPLHRRWRWGRHLELLILDTRSARDPNDAADSAEQPKSMLGTAQRAWFEAEVSRADATWLVVVSSVPMGIPTGGWVRDGWASAGGPTGFARELHDLLSLLRDHGRRQVVWLTTDVHFSAVLRHRPLADDPGFVVYEIAVGPLNAGIAALRDPDPIYHSDLLFAHGPTAWQTVRSFDEALGWFTFGLLEVDQMGNLTARVVDGTGRTLHRMEISPE